MLNRVVLDTNIISAFVNTEDSLHSKSLQLLDSIEKHAEVFIPSVVMVELILVQAQTHQIEPAQIVKIARELATEITVWDESMLPVAAKIKGKLVNKLRTVDFMILTTAYKFNATLLTFDFALEKAAAKLGISH